VASRIRGENEIALHNGKPFDKLYTLKLLITDQSGGGGRGVYE
jgi:hypothetical protein